MNLKEKIEKNEFEARIFISFSIVIIVCFISFILMKDYQPVYYVIFEALGIESYSSYFFIFTSAAMFFISVLRMWAGSLLSSRTVMSFKVVSDSFVTSGPYILVRNPIYFADWLAMCIFCLYMSFAGVLLPLLFYIHYFRLIKYEEKSFGNFNPYVYSKYLNEVSRLLPSFKSLSAFLKNHPQLSLNSDGIRHNALYLLFVPGFLVGYFTDSFLYTVITGIPAVIDWAVVHTIIGLNKSSSVPVKKKKVFDDVLYSQCWEDPQMDRSAFGIRQDDVVFSISSGGCNVLTFLIDNPKSIISLDLNPHQNYLLELKIAAFKYLPYDWLLELMGVTESKRRTGIYDLIKYDLSDGARNFWDGNPKKICEGIINCGRYEHYIKLLRNVLRLIVSKRTLRKIYKIKDPEQRKQLFEKKWNNLRWKIFTKVLLSRKTMSLLFDKAFFRFLKDDFSFGDHFAEKVKMGITGLPLDENYFLRYILFGNYDEKYLPVYLRKENYEIIKKRINRIQIVTDSCDHFFKKTDDDSISKFNFTNIFEWISEDDFKSILKEIIRVAKDNAVITYRNLLVPRQHPESLSDIIFSESRLAEELHHKDLSFIYNNYIVEKIIKEDKKCHTRSSEYILEVNSEIL